MQPSGLPMFDARAFEPKQGMPSHPDGKFPAIVSNTEIAPTKDGTGGMFVVEFSTPAGKIVKRYNLFNNSAEAVRIAQHELSALCHATGVYQVDPNNQGAALRNAQLVIEVAPQRKNPEYHEVVKVYDRNGNEPGKPGGAAPQPAMPPAQPQYQAPQGGPAPAQAGWTPNAATGPAPQQPAQPGPAPAQGGWGPPPAQPPAGTQPAVDWSQGAQSGAAPWGQR